MRAPDVRAGNSSPEKQPDVANKNICKIHIFLFGGVGIASTGPRGLELLTGASEQDTSTTSSLCSYILTSDGGKNKIGKQQCLPNLRRQLLLQDKHPNNYCIFKYIMIVPTSAFQKIYNRRTLGLLLRCLK